MAEGDAKSERLPVFLDPHTIEYLKDLSRTGTHGNCPARVAKALIEEGVRAAIRDGLIPGRRFDDDQ